MTSRIRRTVPLLAALAALVCAPWHGDAGEAERNMPAAVLGERARDARGSYDMSQNPRPFAVFLILDQEGNRYPSFWCGRNLGGRVSFHGEMDMLDGVLRLNPKGSFVMQITHAARKQGMKDVLPGGPWISNLASNNVRIEVEALIEPTFKGVRRIRLATVRGLTGEGDQVQFDAGLRGKLHVGNRSAPIEGTASLGFMTRIQSFTFQARFPVPAEALGIEGPAGRGIVATLHTFSPRAQDAGAPPTLDAGSAEETPLAP